MRIHPIALATVLLVPALVCGACAQHKARPKVLPDARAAYHYAVETYQAGAYNTAARLFGEIADTSPDPLLSRQAFFGLVLSRLAGARTPAEFDSAVDLWRTWYSLAPADPSWEDPRLFSLFLDRLRPQAQALTQLPAPIEKPEVEAVKPLRAAGECADSLNKLAASRQENERLKEQLKELALENERLRSQLTALEQLHQEILIKKKGFD